QIRDCPRHDMWIDGRPIATGHLKPWTTCIYDLRQSPMANCICQFQTLHFYMPRMALNAIGEIENAPKIDDLDHNPGIGVDDEVLRGLGASLLPAFERPHEANPLFVDHVTIAAAAHFVNFYGGNRHVIAPSDRLAPWQESRIKDLLSGNLAG